PPPPPRFFPAQAPKRNFLIGMVGWYFFIRDRFPGQYAGGGARYFLFLFFGEAGCAVHRAVIGVMRGVISVLIPVFA
ncbi:hypothetical protein ACVGWW_01595, partial [Enterobacter hormaechei]